MIRRRFLHRAGLFLFGTLTQGLAYSASGSLPRKRVLVITDIGSDIDDTWALATLVSLRKKLDFEIEAVLCSTYDTHGRAKVAAKLMEGLGADDVPIWIGTETSRTEAYMKGGYQAGFHWAKDYALEEYKGDVVANGYQQLLRLLRSLTTDDILDVILLAPTVELTFSIGERT